jgi:long-chain-fatty-acid--[acyl-carrier-protein] ligase
MLKKLWVGFIFLVVRGLIGIRYRVRVRGLDQLKLTRPGGLLFLPNHPAEVDPVILTLALWRKYRAHPLVVEYFYYLKGAHYLQTLVGAVPIPDLDGIVNRWKQKKIEKTFKQIVDQLKSGTNFMIYPAGRLKRTAEELIGGASFVYNLVQECPEANIVLVRTTGLWGSRFSRALTGSTPSLGGVLWEGFKIVLKNLILLTPRREVTIELESPANDFPFKAQRLEFNRYLERWYNLRGPEPLKLVSDAFWKESYPKVMTEKPADTEVWVIDPEVETQVIAKINQLARRTDVTRSHHLARDLGLDSLDIAQLNTFLDEKFEIEGLEPGELQTVEDVLKAISRQEKRVTSIKKPVKRWPQEDSRPAIAPPPGKTLQEAFLRNCDRMDNYVACADEMLGVVSYRRFKMMALLLKRQIEKMEGDRIGILMPSTTLSYALIFGTLLAKKVPVMLNWTVGVRAIDHCVHISGIKTVISSRRFLDNLSNGDLGSVDDILVLVEDIRSQMSFFDKIYALYGSLIRNADSLLKNYTAVSEDDPAVILFTSGTESLPKGVPLSHKNILSNQASALSCVKFVPKDALYCVLPPFHSFGYSVTGTLPLMTGLKAYYAPDPTHNHAMSHDITNWELTLFCSAPTFIKGLFRVSKPEALKSLRYVVGGAEKVPDELFAFMKEVGGEMLEGYGITECGPIVTLMRPGQSRHGVGQPIPGVHLCIIDPETGQLLPLKQDGEICIDGPNVFHGYLDNPRNPFIEIENRQWYRSGDRGHIDADGSLVLTGRLTRFMKIGGEMVSIGGLEEELLKLAHDRKWVSRLEEGAHPLAIAVEEKESEKPLIILFTTFEIDKETVNEALRECGYGRLIKIAAVRKIEQIPVTGTGKIHYRALDEIIQH